jgi:hypothetical protein
MSALIALIAGLVSGAVTSVITYFATAAKIRLELTIEYDKELRKERLSAYLKLWPKLKPLARYSPPSPVSRQLVKDTSEDMRDWYFDTGGVYLSRESRDHYFKLKGTMQKIIDDPEILEEDGSLPGKWVKTLHYEATRLRAALSDDIGTRQEPFLRSRWFRRVHQNSSAKDTSTESDWAASGADLRQRELLSYSVRPLRAEPNWCQVSAWGYPYAVNWAVCAEVGVEPNRLEYVNSELGDDRHGPCDPAGPSAPSLTYEPEDR